MQSENPRCILIPGVNRAIVMYTVQLYILNESTTKSIYLITAVIAGLAIMKCDYGSFIFCDNNFALASLFILPFNHRIVPGAVGKINFLQMCFCREINKKRRGKKREINLYFPRS